MSDEPVQIENTKVMLDERERVSKPKRTTHQPKQAQAQRAVPSWRRWMLSLDLDELITLFQDPTGTGAWNEELRGEILELIRSKGGDQAVRRAIGLHFDRPAARDDRPDGDGRRRLWRGTAVAEPGRLRAVERVGRAWVEAALAWRLERLEADPQAPPVLDLTAPLMEHWPDLVPPPLAEGVPGVELDLSGPRRLGAPSQLLRQHEQALAAIIDGAGGLATTVYGRVERSDGSIEWVYSSAAQGLAQDALRSAFDEISPPGIFVGRVRRLGVLLWPALAHHDPETLAILVGRRPLETPPDPVRPGPMRFELVIPSPTVTWRAHLGPEAAAGVTGVLNAPRVLRILGRISNRGFLPTADPAARLAPPAPVVRRKDHAGARVVWTRRPGDAKACAAFTGTVDAIVTARDAIIAAGDEESVRAAALTAPDGPVPAPLP